MVESAGKKVLIDALFDSGFGAYLAPSADLLEQMTGARGPFASVDLLLVTHPHGDHFDPKLTVAYLRTNPGCRLVAHTQTVDRLRKEEGFDQVSNRVSEISCDPGAREHRVVNGVPLDVLCLPHSPYYRDGRNVHADMRDLAFLVELGGARFLHLGDATIEHSADYLGTYPFEQKRIDVLFLAYFDRAQAAQRLVAEKIKPGRIVAMHVPPAQWTEEVKGVRAAYPHAIAFRHSMERRSLVTEVDLHDLSGAYLGQSPPGATPEVFGPGMVSTDANEHSAPSFSPDGNEVFWFANRPPGPDNEEWSFMSMTMRRVGGRWSAPQVAPFDGMVALSPDGRRAYVHSGEDIWVAEKQGDHWGEPRCLDIASRFQELKAVYMPSVTASGTLYFIGQAPGLGLRNDMGIYRSEPIHGEYAKPQLLPSSVNRPPFLNWAPFIAPDESSLLFSSNRRDPDHDGGDLYISRRLADGSWTDPVSLGEPVNSPRQEVFPGLSPDGKYLFFARDTPDRGNDVYWVDAATVAPLRAETNLPQRSVE